MTANTSDVYSGNLRPDNSDEIDIRRYLVAVTKWWREILAISILAGVLGGIAIFLLNHIEKSQYSASADIIIARLATNIQLDDRVSTSNNSGQGDQNGWRASLLQLAKGSDVANAVLDELKHDLPLSLSTTDSLLAGVDVSIPLSPDERYSSNLIRIKATTSDPELSEKITNSWARHLIDFINGVYGEVPQNMLDSVTQERDASLGNYQKAEKALEDFVANNQIDMLTRQIQEKSVVRDSIMDNYTNMLTAAVSVEYNAQLKLYNTLTEAPVAHAAAVVAAQSEGNIRALQSLYSLRAGAITQRNQARNMQHTLEEGGEAAAKSNVAALQLLKLSTFASLQNAGKLPTTVSLTGMSPNVQMSLDEQLTDVRSLVSVLDAYVTQLDGNIKQLAGSNMIGADLAVIGAVADGGALTATAATTATQPLADPYAHLFTPQGLLSQTPVDINKVLDNTHETVLANLETEIRTLQAQIAAERAKQQELTHARDLAWTTFDTVGNKLQELQLLRSSANSEVRLGNPALIPLLPEPKMGLALPVAAITLFAFFLAVVLALIADSLGSVPFFTRRPASAR